MEYRVEIEFRNGGRIVRYYYWCPRCGYRVSDLVVNVGKNGGKVRIVLEEYVTRTRPARQSLR